MNDPPPVPQGLFQVLRELAVSESFGGPAMFELLKSRNPEINMILNAGIAAGALYGSLKERSGPASRSSDPVP